MSDEHKSCCGVSRSQVLKNKEQASASDGRGGALNDDIGASDGQGGASDEGNGASNGQLGAAGEGSGASNADTSALNEKLSTTDSGDGTLNVQGVGSDGGNVQSISTEMEMVRIPGGKFLMGTNVGDGFPQDGEAPIHNVRVKSFRMAVHTVTNAQFSDFIQETGYVTDAEKFGWSFVFYQFVSEKTAAAVTQKVRGTPWWWVVEGATWNHPEGPDSDIVNRLDHPVVHVSWNDAAAYCEWAEVRLPTEAEWERAARGGLEQKRYPWGDELTPGGEHLCNIWQGDFPRTNSEEDGYAGTAPAVSFPANGYGLYNVSGNVWEWCADWFATNIHKRGGKDNPAGPSEGESRVMRGGSYLCHHSYCNRYRVGARSANTPDSSTGNLGFRVVSDE